MPKFQRLCIYANYQQFKRNAALPYQSLLCGFSPQYVEVRVVFSTIMHTMLLLKTSWSIVEIKYPKYICITLANVKPKSNI